MIIKKKGFTLIELLIVIVIIGILAVAFLPTALNAPKRARDAQRKAHLSTIVQAIEQYGLDNAGTYPTSGCIDAKTWDSGKLDSYFRDGAPPKDPSNQRFIGAPPTITILNTVPQNCTPGQYYYGSSTSTNKCYIVGARMEDAKSGNVGTSTGVDCTSPNPFPGSGDYFLIRNKT